MYYMGIEKNEIKIFVLKKWYTSIYNEEYET